MSFLRRLSTRGLLLLAAAAVVVAAGGAAIAVAASRGAAKPQPKPLAQALHDALAAQPVQGITARIRFTNSLFPSGSILGQVGSALMSGASGRLWATADGRGRLELQSDAGDVQVVWNGTELSVYDASSNTVYRAQLPQHDAGKGGTTQAPPALAQIDAFLRKLGDSWAISGARPTDVAGQPAYSVSVSPKHDGGLLGSLRLAWDAVHGTPLRIGIYAQGSSTPVLELAVTDISYGAVAPSDVDVAPPAGAKVVDLGSAPTAPSGPSTPAVTGIDAVRAAAGFPVVAPDSLVGLPRKDVRLVGGGTVLAFYGQGLGGLVLVERKADAAAGGAAGPLSSLPTVALDGLTAHELATPLGTALEWQSGGTAYVLAGSLPPAAAEAAARAVR
ncbi:MAG TPA: hypothetical protein VFL60_03790 [Gaiellaceae bacterium]|nr:hypothetical protein [Gaiellaceae bacterium]